MSFLTPLFLFGALAVALPVIFHLIRRTTREKTVFSSLMFLMPTPPRVTRRSRLENIFLLILRCLVLCLLALGFARPFVQHPLQGDSKTGAAKRVVILLDTSASMRRGNLWTEAQAKATEIAQQASPLDQVAVFTFDRQVNRIINFDQWTAMGANERAAFATKRLAELKPGWGATHLGNALVTAAEALEEKQGTPQENFAVRQVVLISDLQEGSGLDTLQGYEWPKAIEVRIEPVKAKRPTNAGLQLVTETAESEKAATDASPRVRVSNSSDSKREQFQIGWSRGGQSGFAGAPLDVYVPPGQSRIVQAPKSAAGQGDRLLLTGDDDDFDNTVYLSPPHTEEINLCFVGNDAEKDPAQCLYYLKRAFQKTRGQEIRVNPWSAAMPSPPQLETTPLIISTDGASPEQIAAVSRALHGGKMVLLVLKEAASSAKAISQLTGSEGVTVEEGVGEKYAMLGQIDFEHPLFAPFATPRFSDFTKINFWKHRRLGTDRLPSAKVLARFDNGDPALAQLSVGKGTLLILTSGWQPLDSQLALSSKFVPLLYSMLEQSGGIKAQLSQYTVGDTVPLPGAEAGTTNAGQVLLIRKPDGSEVKLARGEKFSQTDLPGTYSVSSVQPVREGQENAAAAFQFAVNIDAAESKTAPLATEELERLGVAVKAQPVQSEKQAEQKRRHLLAAELEHRQKLWRWLIVAALVVLVGETLLAGWLTRRTTVALEGINGA